MKKKTLSTIDQAKKLVIAPLEATDISLCSHCYCITYTIKGKCGRCKEKKKCVV